MKGITCKNIKTCRMHVKERTQLRFSRFFLLQHAIVTTVLVVDFLIYLNINFFVCGYTYSHIKST